MCKTLNYFIHDNIHNIWVEITNKIVFDIWLLIEKQNKNTMMFYII